MDTVLVRKAASLERCIAECATNTSGTRPSLMPTSICRIVVLNLQRACQLAIDMALRIGPTRRPALPADTAEMFRILAQAGLITAT